MEREKELSIGDPFEQEGFRKVSFYTPADVQEKESRSAILSNLMLTWAGCYTKARGHVVEGRILQDYVMIYCVDGSGWLRMGEHLWTIGKGDLFLCPPDVPHSYGASESAPWTKYWVHFRGSSAAAYTNLLKCTVLSPVLHIGSHPLLLTWFQDIFDLLRGGYTQSSLLCATAYVGQILSTVNSLAQQHGPRKEEVLNVDKMVAFMLEHVNGSLTLDQMAAYAGLSKYHFVRLFRGKTGYTPVDYHNRLRIQRACELLESSSSKVGEVALSLGFGNPYYFSTTFKRIVGRSPSGYRALL